ncbi:MAG: hypothetical protein WDN44_09875 [Sphingomonas sp.]
MRSTVISSARDRVRTSFGRRGGAALLALAIEALIVLLLLTLAPPIVDKPKPKPTFLGFDTTMDTEDKTETKAKAKPRSRAAAAEPQPVRPVEPVPPPPLPPPPLKPSANVIWLTRQQYVSSDLAKAPPPGPKAAVAPAEGDSRADDSEVVGTGPHGEPLYAAEWYTRPTNAQLWPYVSDRAREGGGWGEIACRMVENYRVEDCQELADSPRGSGLAGSVRQAAWQFRVRPPRKGGHALIGAWVRIRIDYTIERGSRAGQ